MLITPIKTRVLRPPKDNFLAALDDALPPLRERDVVCITSKVVSIHQGRCIPIRDVPDKDKLIEQEADLFLSRAECPKELALLTIKENTLIATAGIDESNADGHYILWPTDIQATAHMLWKHLRARHHINDLGIVVTDSHSMPMRFGVTGIAIGFFGIEPFYDYRGTPDLFGRPFHWSRTNLPDSLAAAGVLAMGEGTEQTPVAIARDIPFLTFTTEDRYKQWVIKKEKDIYYPLLKVFEMQGEADDI